jgi:exodeoxyribonuclease VII small subunit
MSESNKAVASEVEALSFEDAFNELEKAVQRLEGGDLTLDEAIALYERGIHLAQRCSDTLDSAELKVQELAVVRNQQQIGMFSSDEGAP